MRSSTLTITTRHREEILIITPEIQKAITESGVSDGLCLISTPHTTAAIAVNENADPDVPLDLVRALRAMVPNVRFDHGEGNSDAHLLAMIIGPSEMLAVRDGRLALGRWQGIYFVELDGPRKRQVAVDVIAGDQSGSAS